MRYLLDTHSFLWYALASRALSREARTLLQLPTTTLVLSLASLWELAIKANLGRIELPQPFRSFAPQHIERLGVELLTIRWEHVERVAMLPRGGHGDPFDRMIAAQSLVEQLPLV